MIFSKKVFTYTTNYDMLWFNYYYLFLSVALYPEFWKRKNSRDHDCEWPTRGQWCEWSTGRLLPMEVYLHAPSFSFFTRSRWHFHSSSSIQSCFVLWIKFVGRDGWMGMRNIGNKTINFNHNSLIKSE